MAIHAPAVHPRHMPSVAGLGPFVLAIVFLAMLAALLFWAVPRTTTTTPSQVWMTEQRHGEIDAGRLGGPHSDVLQYRQGEFRAGIVPMPIRASFNRTYPGGFTSTYAPVVAGPMSATQYPGGFTSAYNPLHLTMP